MMIQLLLKRVALLPVLAMLAATVNAQTLLAPPAPLSVIAFDGGWNVPRWAAQRQGYFEANGVAVQLRYTPNSVFLIDSLLEGRHDVGLALIDNLVAFMGVDGGFPSVVASPTVKSFADLKGKMLSVDAVTTGAAIVRPAAHRHSVVHRSDVSALRPPAHRRGTRLLSLVADVHVSG